MENKVKQFGWKRNWDYIKVNFFIMWKTLIEYKVTMFSAFLEQIFFLSIQFFFFKVLSENFADNINWLFTDFILFAFLIDFMFILSGIFYWSKNLRLDLLEGKLNLYLLKPLNIFLSYQLNKLSTSASVMTIMNLIFFPIFLIYFKINLYSIYLGILVFILIVLFQLSFELFLKSINFWSFGLSESLSNIYRTINHNFAQQYPWQFLKGSIFKYLTLSFAVFFISSLLIPILRSYEIWRIDIQLLILIVMILLLSLGTVINWHYGLKKYEAFG